MAFSLTINRDSGIPVYRQIIERVTDQIRRGELKPGDRLPPEREIAEKYDISRGTVKKALEELERNRMIDVTQGRGTFIAREQEIENYSRKEIAIERIDQFIFQLREQKFSFREIGIFFQLRLMEIENKMERINLAVIDCNPETLLIIEEQLRKISSISIHTFLLDDVLADPSAVSRLSGFDLLITTSTHYSELTGALSSLADLRDKLIQVAVSPSQGTIIELAQIPATAKVTILCESPIFMNIVQTRLKAFQIKPSQIKTAYYSEQRPIDELIDDRDILIVPRHWNPAATWNNAAQFEQAVARGFKIIQFDYQMERGSLMHIEERITQISNTY